jgi:hypothetical protein
MTGMRGCSGHPGIASQWMATEPALWALHRLRSRVDGLEGIYLARNGSLS